MRVKVLFLVTCLLGSAILTGCAGKREINELALVMAVGLDKGKNGKVVVSVQIARPADARGQTGAPAGNTGDPIWSAKAEGATIFEAIRNLSTFSTRRVFWAHNFIIVINEDLARDGISDIIDFFTRNPELRMKTWVVVTPNKASNILSTMTGLEVISGEAMDKLFRYSQISAQAPKSQMLDVQSAFLSESSEPVIARVKLINRGISNKKPVQVGSIKQIELAGAGVFKGDQLVGILSPNETRGLLPFIQKVDSGVFTLTCPNNPSKKVTVELKNYKFKVTPHHKAGKPRFQVHAKIIFSMVEAGCPISLKDKNTIEKLEKDLTKKMNHEMDALISKVQKDFKSDIFELGKVFNNKYPKEWKKLKHNWEQEFQTASISTAVSVKIENTVLLTKPTKEKQMRDK